jgi:hypothetical protein
MRGPLHTPKTVGTFKIPLVQFIVILIIELALVSPAIATTYYVDAARPDNSGDGTSWAAAKKTIQAGINASTANDTILVKYGLYVIAEACSVGSNRKITSDDGTHNSWDTADFDSSQCIIDANSVCRVMEIIGPTVSSLTVIRGFKLTNGIATNEGDPNYANGGGIFIIDEADPVIEYCWITNNIAGTNHNGYGGGIAIIYANAEPTIRYNIIDNNIATTSWFGYGGGIYCLDVTAAYIYGNSITNNTASTNRVGHGGGICCQTSTAEIWDNTISGNVGSGPGASGGARGGGIYAFSSPVDIHDNIVTYNTATHGVNEMGYGGGIYCEGEGTIIRDNPDISHNVGSSAGRGSGGGICCPGFNSTITGNVITYNTASTSNSGNAYYRYAQGGGMVCGNNGNLVSSNTISNNVASENGEGRGGGIYFDSGQTIERNIISYNAASNTNDGSGGGTWSYNSGATSVVNNAFYRNANKRGAAGSGTGSGMHHNAGGTPTISNNIFMNHDVVNSDSVAVHSNPAITITYNCFHNNPGGDYNASVTSLNEPGTDPRFTDADNGDFTLMYDSPCIETGNPSYACPEDGGWIVDIGAIEYTGTRHKRSIPGTGEFLFGGQVKAKVNVTALGSLTDIDMIVHPGETHTMAPASVWRWYDIEATGGGTTFDLTLSYKDSEKSWDSEDDLYLWRWTGSVWEGPKAPSSADTTENWLTVPDQTVFSDWVITDPGGPTAVGKPKHTFRYELAANFPNPFNPLTTIAYSLGKTSRVRLTIYDVRGRVVNVLVDREQPVGQYRTSWDGRDSFGSQAASGVYFLKLSAGDFSKVRKMVLIR